MADSGKKGKGQRLQSREMSRRQFLKGAALAAGTAMIGLPGACNQAVSTETTSANSPSFSSEPAGTLPVSGGNAISPYVPPTVQPASFKIPGTECYVARDRVYSPDNLWVKQIAGNAVAIGITSTMFHIINNPYRCSLSPLGTNLRKGDTFGAIEGFKMATDFVAPVSGTITQTNPLVVGYVDTGDSYLVDFADPYNRGWTIVVELSNKSEMSALLSPDQYANLVEGKGA